MNVPFNRPTRVGNEANTLATALLSPCNGAGHYTEAAERLLAEFLKVPRVLLTTSCTDALEMSALLLRIQDGDRVIVPAYTYPSSIGAFTLHGARPIFVDINPDTLNIDERLVSQHISGKVRAIVVVHYNGIPCDMTLRFGGVSVVEDAAHCATEGTFEGRPLGTIGTLGTYSFHDTKNICCGEGGALIINDPLMVDRAEIIRQCGTNRAAFLQGKMSKYEWVDTGSSYLPSELNAAMLFTQLLHRTLIYEKRVALWLRYYNALYSWAKGVHIFMPEMNPGSAHVFWLRCQTNQQRTWIRTFLADVGIAAEPHYLALNDSPMARKYSANTICPVAEHCAQTVLRLPFYTTMTEYEQDYVIQWLTRSL